MKFLVNLVYDTEGKGYVAGVPELPGCMSQGKTIEKAMANVRKAITLYLSTVPGHKRPKSRPALTTVVEV